MKGTADFFLAVLLKSLLASGKGLDTRATCYFCLSYNTSASQKRAHSSKTMAGEPHTCLQANVVITQKQTAALAFGLPVDAPLTMKQSGVYAVAGLRGFPGDALGLQA